MGLADGSVRRARDCSSSHGARPTEEDLMFELYDSEELLGTEAGEIAESSPLHSSAYEELVDVSCCGQT